MKTEPAANQSSGNDEEQRVVDRWVETWRIAGPELEAIHRREGAAVPLHLALRQLFDGMDSVFAARASGTSGLVEQQMWFRRIGDAVGDGTPAAPESGE
jgi:hypothetical protein